MDSHPTPSKDSQPPYAYCHCSPGTDWTAPPGNSNWPCGRVWLETPRPAPWTRVTPGAQLSSLSKAARSCGRIFCKRASNSTTCVKRTQILLPASTNCAAASTTRPTITRTAPDFRRWFVCVRYSPCATHMSGPAHQPRRQPACIRHVLDQPPFNDLALAADGGTVVIINNSGLVRRDSARLRPRGLSDDDYEALVGAFAS